MLYKVEANKGPKKKPKLPKLSIIPIFYLYYVG